MINALTTNVVNELGPLGDPVVYDFANEVAEDMPRIGSILAVANEFSGPVEPKSDEDIAERQSFEMRVLQREVNFARKIIEATRMVGSNHDVSEITVLFDVIGPLVRDSRYGGTILRPTAALLTRLLSDLPNVSVGLTVYGPRKALENGLSEGGMLSPMREYVDPTLLLVTDDFEEALQAEDRIKTFGGERQVVVDEIKASHKAVEDEAERQRKEAVAALPRKLKKYKQPIDQAYYDTMGPSSKESDRKIEEIVKGQWVEQWRTLGGLVDPEVAASRAYRPYMWDILKAWVVKAALDSNPQMGFVVVDDNNWVNLLQNRYGHPVSPVYVDRRTMHFIPAVSYQEKGFE